MVLGIILSQDKYSRLRSVIGRATPRRVTGIFRDFFCWTMKREKERKIKRREGREYETKEGKKEGDNKCASICNESFRNESRFHRI